MDYAATQTTINDEHIQITNAGTHSVRGCNEMKSTEDGKVHIRFLNVMYPVLLKA